MCYVTVFKRIKAYAAIMGQISVLSNRKNKVKEQFKF